MPRIARGINHSSDEAPGDQPREGLARAIFGSRYAPPRPGGLEFDRFDQQASDLWTPAPSLCRYSDFG